MAQAPRHPCAAPGCPHLLGPGIARCPQHARERAAQDLAYRGTSAARGYDADWRRLRNMHLAANPWCVMHLARGEQVRATLVHHIHEPRGDESLALDPENLASVCRSCHTAIHAGRGLPGHRA